MIKQITASQPCPAAQLGPAKAARHLHNFRSPPACRSAFNGHGCTPAVDYSQVPQPGSGVATRVGWPPPPAVKAFTPPASSPSALPATACSMADSNNRRPLAPVGSDPPRSRGTGGRPNDARVETDRLVKRGFSRLKAFLQQRVAQKRLIAQQQAEAAQLAAQMAAQPAARKSSTAAAGQQAE